MAEHGSITGHLGDLADGKPEAVDVIWDAYFDRMVRLAKGNIQRLPLRDADEEDIALSAMHSFMRGAVAGRFDDVGNRDELWKLLVTITLRKVSQHRKRIGAKKRGAMQVRGESALLNDGQPELPAFDGVANDELPPEVLVEMQDTCSELIERLGDDVLRQIAGMRLDGYTNVEIGERIGIVERSVERKLRRIRAIWADDNYGDR